MDERSSVASPPTPESIPSTHGLISSHSSPPDSSTTPSHPITDEERQQMARAWNETLRFPNAAQPEIIRAGQKDEYFINTLQDLLESTLGGLVGVRWLTRRSHDVRDAARVLYYLLTTLSASQTLGEEYCDVVQIDARTGRYPSIKRRAVWMLVHIFSPRALSTLYTQLRSRLVSPLDNSQELNEEEPPESPTKPLFRRLKDTVSAWMHLLPNTLDLGALESISSLHLAIFYLTGRYFQWSNRLTKIRYLSTQLRPLQGQGGARAEPPSYEILGLLIIVQLIVKLTVSVKHAQRRRQTERSIAELNPSNPKSNPREKECDSPQTETSPDRPPIIDRITIDEILFEPDDDNDDSAEEESDTGFKSKEVGVAGVESDHTSEEPTSRRCTLCLGPRRDQSSLECGHVFCWKCVVGWIREKPECPLCRQAVKITDLLPLYNF